ncbi:MAG: hypothetical protein AB7O91_05980, partial [Sphingomonas sp.]
DASNPAFRDWYRRGFDEALALAARVDSYAGYFFAIQRYMTGFQDGHLGALVDDRFDSGVRLRRQWPGFLVGLDRGAYRVVETAAGGPPAGSRLEGCDGRDAEALENEILAPYFPLWTVRGARARSAPFLLIDEGNPFVRRPAECTFEADGRRVRVRLAWAPVASEALAPRVRAAQGRFEAPTEIRRFGDNGWWLALPTFNAGDEAVAVALVRIIETIERRPADFRDAGTIVIDVRGNMGGSSEFGDRIARALWGAPFIDSLPSARAVDWRVSRLNVRQIALTNLPRLVSAFGENDPRTTAYAAFARTMRAALDRGDAFHHDPTTPQPAPQPAAPVRARIFFLTDGWCGSACLDFADRVLAAPGVVHVGAETSADTIYIDNTAAWLPSGEGLLGWSMKVFRGRPRGHNQSYVPRHVWQGSMADTAELERWIAGLARGG